MIITCQWEGLSWSHVQDFPSISETSVRLNDDEKKFFRHREHVWASSRDVLNWFRVLHSRVWVGTIRLTTDDGCTWEWEETAPWWQLSLKTYRDPRFKPEVYYEEVVLDENTFSALAAGF